MGKTIRPCPHCTSETGREHLAGGWEFCSVCGLPFLLDDQGKVLRRAQRTKFNTPKLVKNEGDD